MVASLTPCLQHSSETGVPASCYYQDADNLNKPSYGLEKVKATVVQTIAFNILVSPCANASARSRFVLLSSSYPQKLAGLPLRRYRLDFP